MKSFLQTLGQNYWSEAMWEAVLWEFVVKQSSTEKNMNNSHAMVEFY